MNKEDYFKYYIQGSDHYLIPKDVFKELFNEMINWKEESKKQKEVIDKAIEYIDIETKGCDEEPIEGSWLYDLYAIRDILGDKENE